MLTHPHADHVGVAERLREAGARVYVHEADEKLATTGKALGKNEASMLRYLRYPAAWRLTAHLGRNGALKPQRIGAVTTFSDGEVLDVPGRPRAIHTPGHTEGHTVLHLEEHGALIVGDLLCTYNPLTGAHGPQAMPRALSRSTQRNLDSLSRIEGLEGTLHVGHGDPWTGGVRAAVERAREVGPT